MEKLVVCIMGDFCSRTMDMCIKSVESADKIVFCWGKSDIPTKIKLEEWKNRLDNFEVIENEYNQEDKAMNGKQRQVYLNFLKDNYPDSWILCIDSDEILEDLSKIKEFIQDTNIKSVFSVKMRHFIGDLGHEDAVTPEHWVPKRLFKISEAIRYPETEHPILEHKGEHGLTDCTTIWHLAYIPNLWEIKKRYENHLKKSNMHTPEYLDNWYKAHLFGAYPKTEINVTDIPEIILKEFGIDRDEFYFANRGLEAKHFLMTKQWCDYLFGKMYGSKECAYQLKIIDFGCGKAPYGIGFINQDCEYKGIELSRFAVEHSFLPIEQGDIINWTDNKEYDLCLCFDILEHLSYEDLDTALNNIKEIASDFIFSIPFKDNPDCENDKTHKIKESKEWWLKKLGNYFEIEKTPDWHYKEQIIVGRKK